MAEDFNHFDDLANAFDEAISKVVRKAALDIQGHAAGNAPVDTGFLRNSIYTVTSDSSDYKGGEKALPEVEKPDDNQTAYVAVGAQYGIYVNYGTRFMPARAFWEPAIDAVRPGFEEALSRIEDKMREVKG